ncbi:MAG: UDP-N-acetylglucosamine--N-acetylmuramyl-(pentapeptide) pyrophosphoryl-undecaprenol N-acetylglucosamine transferase [Gemmatimonadota bacterium]|nr:MAG: UDP-N-acetylglucosamine--N-acetylmuramyl-(pentapeptide) pyrophosphoryl-undecaprenol N-acetylglucosamine transferase [Gemmatimonadota bacterium]
MGYRAIVAGGGTGGHLYPALNLAAALERRSMGSLEVLLVGAERGIESRVLPDKGVDHRLLPLQPIYRSRPWRNWRTLVSAFAVARDIKTLFASFAPNLVVGTGGYVAGPVVAWAAARNLPTAIQEQNSYPGVTTRWLAPYVDQIHLGYAEAMRYLLPGRTTEVRAHGVPIGWPEQRPEPQAVRRQFALRAGRLVLAAGGSQGSASLNAALLAGLEAASRGDLPGLPPETQLLWSTGPAHHDAVSRRLDELKVGPEVTALSYIDGMEKVLSLATLAVSRAGAVTLAEYCAWGVPSVLVPLPHATAQHQLHNARALAAAGAALVVEEGELGESPELLWRELIGLLSSEARLERMGAAARRRGNPDAADRIADDLWRLLEDR